jgi:hypothetical protein
VTGMLVRTRACARGTGCCAGPRVIGRGCRRVCSAPADTSTKRGRHARVRRVRARCAAGRTFFSPQHDRMQSSLTDTSCTRSKFTYGWAVWEVRPAVANTAARQVQPSHSRIEQ